MNIVEESLRLHRESWNDQDNYLGHLKAAENLLRTAYEGGNRDPLIVNNLAAILLDQNKNIEALLLMKENPFDFSEYCSNRAIAIAKADYNLKNIRKWNAAASKSPSMKNAIIAYMDWQGL